MSHAPSGTPCDCGLRGWMQSTPAVPVEHLPIRWQRPAHIVRESGQMQPYVITEHIAQGFISTIDDWATNGESRIITHFGIERGGRTVQYQEIYTEGIHVSSVSEPSSAIVQKWGSVAGRGVNPYSIGIEHEGFSVAPGYGYDYLYSRENPWPEPMVHASIAVKRWIFDQPDTNLGAPSRDSIIGHYEADLRNRVDDPAPRHDRSIWPRDRMVAALTKSPPKSKETAIETDYTVIAPGEWLSRVAERTGLTVARLAALNGIADPGKVDAYQILRLNDSVERPPVADPRLQWTDADAVDVAAIVRFAAEALEHAKRIQARHK